jgi:hypothetical protein
MEWSHVRVQILYPQMVEVLESEMKDLIFSIFLAFAMAVFLV